jgi:ketosteroid isomerase-like protein
MKTYGLTTIAAAWMCASVALAASQPAAAPAVAAAKPGPAATPAGPSDEAQIRALEARFAAAFHAKDVNAIMRAYATDGLLVFDVVPPRQYVGAAAYRKDWTGFLGGLKGQPKIDITDLKIVVGGNLAYSHSIQRLTGTNAKGPMTLTVRVTDVYRKQGGAWKIVHEHVSAPIDLDSGKPDLTSAP